MVSLYNTEYFNATKKRWIREESTFFFPEIIRSILLVAQRADAGQNLALEQLKRSATTGGAEGKLVSHLELLSSGYGVATTYDGDAIGLS